MDEKFWKWFIQGGAAAFVTTVLAWFVGFSERVGRQIIESFAGSLSVDLGDPYHLTGSEILQSWGGEVFKPNVWDNLFLIGLLFAAIIFLIPHILVPIIAKKNENTRGGRLFNAALQYYKYAYYWMTGVISIGLLLVELKGEGPWIYLGLALVVIFCSGYIATQALTLQKNPQKAHPMQITVLVITVFCLTIGIFTFPTRYAHQLFDPGIEISEIKPSGKRYVAVGNFVSNSSVRFEYYFQPEGKPMLLFLRPLKEEARIANHDNPSGLREFIRNIKPTRGTTEDVQKTIDDIGNIFKD
jgi:hypothetical protein